MSSSQPESSVPDTNFLCAAKATENMDFAKYEKIKMLSITQESKADICKSVEGLGRENFSAKTAFRRLCSVFQLFLEAAPRPVQTS